MKTGRKKEDPKDGTGGLGEVFVWKGVEPLLEGAAGVGSDLEGCGEEDPEEGEPEDEGVWVWKDDQAPLWRVLDVRAEGAERCASSS